MAGPGGLAERWRSLTVEQKLSVGVLGVAGLVTLVFSLVRVRTALIQPFTTDVQALVELKKQFGPSQEELTEQQKNTDTDGDGVSDFDELNTYGTSIYVRDSDSDGEPDNIEIAKGTDPNCAKGTPCSVSRGTEAATGTAASFEPPPLPDYSLFPGGGAGIGGGSPSPVPPRDAAAIRVYLQASGWNAAEIANFSDEQILEAYDQSTASLGGSATSSVESQ